MDAAEYLQNKEEIISAGNYAIRVVALEDAKNALELARLEAKLEILKPLGAKHKFIIEALELQLAELKNRLKID